LITAGGGIIDLLNKRLRDRLREDEILTIFADVCEAVAHMHTLSQPLLHRDLKVGQSDRVSEHILTYCSYDRSKTSFARLSHNQAHLRLRQSRLFGTNFVISVQQHILHHMHPGLNVKRKLLPMI
jgi:serine/threonine protein kinase